MKLGSLKSDYRPERNSFRIAMIGKGDSSKMHVTNMKAFNNSV